jgi:hypothetical protein
MGTPRKKKLIAIKAIKAIIVDHLSIIGNQNNLGNQKFGFSPWV